MSKSRSVRTLLRAAAGHVARSLVRQANAQVRLRSMQAEALEPRQLLSSSLITGADHAAVGSPYTLNLNALAQSNGSQWAIDWGDGSSVQNVATGQATATHTYAGASVTRTITAGLTNGLANPLDRSFGNLGGGKTVVSTPGVDDKGFDVAVQPDGKLLVAGSTGLTVARFNADGTVDNTFGTNGRATATGGVGTGYGLALQSDGKIVVGGGENFSLARFNANGTLDSSFGSGGRITSGFGSTYAGYDIAVVAGGKIVEVGTNGGTNFIAARFNANGSVDTTFGTSGKATLDFFGSLDKAFALAVQPDGKLLLGGQARDGATNYQFALARYSANGVLDTTFGTNGTGKVTTDLGHTDDAIWDLQLQSDGKIVAAGRGGLSSSTGYDFAAARYTTSGALDTTFGTNGMTKVDFGYGGDQAYALEVLPGDKLLLAGRAQSSANAMNFGLLRLNANGSVDTTFGTAGKVSTDFAGSTDEEEATALLPDGAVILAGGRSTVNANGEMDVALAKYHLETTATLAVTVSDESLAGTGLQASVSFGPDGSMAVPGYRTDIGNSYGLRSNGYTLGWVNPSTGAPTLNANGTFKRNSVGDQRLDTGIGTNGVSWEMAVPNGTYYVKLVAGDPNVTSGTYGYDVEDVAGFLAGTATSGDGRWITATGTVTVTDGKLTIRNASGVTNHALAYVEITDDAARARNTVVAPASVVATASAGNTVDVRWTDKSDNETQFTIERATSSTGTWTTLGTTFANAGLFTDTTASPTTTYYYRVTALKGTAASTAIVSNAITTPVTSPGQIPYDPTRVPWTTQTPVQSEDFDSGGENVSYADNTAGNAGGSYRSGDEDVGYNIADDHYFVGWNKSGEWTEYTINVPTAGLYVLDASVASGGTGGKFAIAVNGTAKASNIQVPDTGSFNTYQQITSATFSLAAGTNQVVRLTATANDPTGYWVGDFDWIKLRLVGTVPAAAGGLTATATSSTSVALTWSDLSNDETGFRIERRPTGGTWAAIDSVAANATSYTDTGAAPRTAYEYRVVVFNAAGDGIASNVAAVTTRAAAPTGLNATPDTVGQKIDLSWTAMSGVDSVVIYRGMSATTLAQYDTAAGGATSYSDLAATDGQPYFYAIAAVVGSVEGDRSTIVSATLTASASSVRADLASDRISIDQPAALQLHSLGNPPLSINSWQIDWGDGTVQTVTGAAGIATLTDQEWDAPHTYATTGTFIIHVVATDIANVTHEAGTFSEAVLLPPPNVSPLVIPPATVGVPVTISATATPYQNNGDPLTFAWTFTDPSDPTHPTQISTSHPSVSFTPPTAGNWSVALNVTDAFAISPTVVTQTLPVAALVPLVIAGPTTIANGATANYVASGSAAYQIVWTVTKAGTVVGSGSGTNFSYQPDEGGAYLVTAVGQYPSGGSASASLTLTVAALSPDVTISGPAVGFVGKPLVFASHLSNDTGGPAAISYLWAIENADGSAVADGSDFQNDLSTFVAPATLTAGQYQIKLLVHRAGDGPVITSTATFGFSVLAVPTGATGFDWAVSPLNSVYDHSGFITESLVQQPDGKIIIVGHVGAVADAGEGDPSFIMRFNADLTADTSFGTNHDGIVIADYDDDTLSPFHELFTDIFSATYNPVNHDLIVVGEVAQWGGEEQPAAFVAEYTTESKYTSNGRIVPAGVLDPDFHHGKAFAMPSTGSPSAMNRATVLSDGSIVAAGIVVTPATDESNRALYRAEYGHDPEGTYFAETLPDYFVIKLTAAGELDKSFGRLSPNAALLPAGSQREGIGQQTDMTGLTATEPFPNQLPGDAAHSSSISAVSSVNVLSDGRILLGGYVNRLALDANGTQFGDGIDVGFGLAEFNADGTLDTSFGDGGITFTSSAAFDGTSDGGAAFSAVQILSDGEIAVAGIAAPRTQWVNDYGNARVVFARYHADGTLDTSYGTAGIILTSQYAEESPPSPFDGFSDGDVNHHLGFRPENAALYFRADGELVGSLQSSTTQEWSVVLLRPNDGSLDPAFGTAGTGRYIIEYPTVDSGRAGQLQAGTNSGTVLLTSDGFLATGNVDYNLNDVPILVRKRTVPSLAVADVIVTASRDTVSLKWTNTGYGEDGFYVERAASAAGLNNSAQIVGVVEKNHHDFTDQSVASNSSYYYRIVPFFADATGLRASGASADSRRVHTLPAASDLHLAETVLVPLSGAAVATSTVLAAGVTYVLVASGVVHLTGDYAVDAGNWYATNDAAVTGTRLAGSLVGISVGTGAEAADVPDWGFAQSATHRYTIAVVGTGAPLSFKLNGVSVGGAFVGLADAPLTVHLYATSTSGALATSPVSVASTRELQGTVTVPLNGSAATSTAILQTGVTYLLVASGHVQLSPGPDQYGSGLREGDAAYWRLNSATGVVDDIAGGVQYGIGINEYNPNGASPENIVPYWGQRQDESHTYVYRIVGDGRALSFKLHSNVFASSLAAGDEALTVQIYAIADPAIQAAAPAAPRRAIVTPTASGGAVDPVISTNTPLSIYSASADGSATPWALWLVSASGQWLSIKSSAESAGQFSGDPTVVDTLVPALYPNGHYTLTLTDSVNDPSHHIVDQRSLVLWTASKAGNLVLPTKDAVISTAIGPVSIVRQYDSSRLADQGYFGAGWTLDLLDTQMTTTSQGDTYDRTNKSPILRPGDLMTFTLPDGSRHVFEFAPVAVEASKIVRSESGLEYTPRFIAIDGSGATLTLTSMQNQNLTVVYDAVDNEFLWADSADTIHSVTNGRAVDMGFTAAPIENTWHFYDFWKYQLTTNDGSSYVINPTSGLIEQATDTSGNKINYTTDAGAGSITARSQQTNAVLFVIRMTSDRRVTSIDIPGQQSIVYSYDAAGNLKSVQGQSGNSTHYSYQDAVNNHLLTGVTDSKGRTTLQAQYDHTNSRLIALTTSDGTRVPVSTVPLGDNDVVQTVVDQAGNVTENVIDQRFGTTVRQIRAETDATGVLGYVVSVTDYSYVIDDIGEMSSLSDRGIYVLQSVRNYAPFKVVGSDASGLRYSQQPDFDSWTKQIVFDTSDDPSNAGKEQAISMSERLDAAGTLRTTQYTGYEVFNAYLQIVKPEEVTVSIEEANASSSTGYDDHVESKTFSNYDAAGNLQYTVKTIGADPTVPGGYLAEGTYYWYTTGDVAGLLSTTQSITAKVSPAGAVGRISTYGPQTQNVYYSYGEVTSGTVAGAAYGRAKYTIDAAGQLTYYAYDAAGRPVLQYSYKTWVDTAGAIVKGWVGTTTVYDAAGRVTQTYAATYRDNSDPHSSEQPVLHTKFGGVAGVDVDEQVYVAPRLTGSKSYNSLGQLLSSTDQYGGVMTYEYDVEGHTIRVTSPDGTEVRTVYDLLGRVTWQTSSFVPATGSGADAELTTHTVYDSLGNAVETETYSGTVITITGKQNGSTTTAAASLTSAGTLVSTNRSYFDPSGRSIETVAPTGLRSGVIYNPDGSVAYSGPLTAAAPDGGHALTEGGVTTFAYVPADFASYNESIAPRFDATLGMLYTRSVDPNQHHTDTYVDGEGRTVRTVYDDGSFSETIYGLGSETVTHDEEGDVLATPSTGWTGVPAGGREEVHVAQRNPGDTPVVTIDLYDASGRLTNVWLPAVTDADPTSPTYSPSHNNQLVSPHWTYLYDQAGNEVDQVSPAEQATYQQWVNAGSGWSFTDTSNPDDQGDQGGEGYWTYTPLAGVTAFGYDQNGNQVRQTLPDGEVQTWTYDTHDRLGAHTDFDGNLATYSYQNSGTQAGDLMSVAYVAPAGSGKTNQTVGYTYDVLGRQQTVVDATGTTTSHYDVAGDLTESDTPEGTIFYDDDLATGRHTGTRTASTSIAYGYTPEDRLDTVTVTKLNGSTLATPLVTGYAYDAAGNKRTETLPNGVVSTWTYDDLDRLTGLTEAKGATPLFSQTYLLNDDGTRASSHEVQRQPDGSDVTVDAIWTYDADGRLTGEQQASSASGESFSDAFSYSLDNNRVKSVHVGPGVGANETVTYAYNGDDELTGQTSSLHGTTTNGYDANGSLTTSTIAGVVTTTYTYDARNKMVGYASDGTTATYAYDDVGNRVAETVNGTTTFYLADTQNPSGYSKPIEAKSSAQALPTTTYLIGERIIGQVDAGGYSTYLLADGHGSTQQITGTTGDVVSEYRYSAFGAGLGFSPTTAQTAILFGGDAIFDSASGIYLHGNGIRGRVGFTLVERDTFPALRSLPASAHRYLYANANPIAFSDPSGRVAGDGFDDLLGDAEAFADDDEIDAEEYRAGQQARGYADDIVARAEFVEENESLVEGELEIGENLVYQSIDEEGNVQYVGITKNFEQRAAAHLAQKGIDISRIPGLTTLTRFDARAVEQVLIETIGLGKNGGTLLNMINSIAESNPIYLQSIERGLEILKSISYPGF